MFNVNIPDTTCH